MRIMLCIFACILLFSYGPANAGCTISEIRSMVKEGAGKKVIGENCDNEVDDAPRCKFSRVVQMAFSKKAEYEIRDECDACDRPRCEVGGNSCAIVQKVPAGARPGDNCWCPAPWGPVQGELSCNN